MTIGNTNIHETYLEVRNQSPPQDETASGMNFNRDYVEFKIPVAFDDLFLKGTEWQESRSNGMGIKTKYKENLTIEGRPRDYFRQQPRDILYRHGHVIEFDSSKEAERIIIHHRIGSYFEMLVDGTIQTKARGDRLVVTIRNHDEFIKGSRRVTVRGNDHKLVEGDEYVQIKQSQIEQIKKDVMKEVLQSMSLKVGGDLYQLIKDIAETTASEIINNADKITDNTSRHNLSSDSNIRKINNWLLCPFKGAVHSTQGEVFCGPGAAGPRTSQIKGTELGKEFDV